MLQTTKSTTLTGQSVIEDEGRSTVVVYFTANVSENGTPSVSKTIQDRSLYKKNRSTCKTDEVAFEEIVDELLGIEEE